MLPNGLLSLIGLAVLGASLLWLISFLLSQRKLPEEKGKDSLHTERCATYWRALGGMLGIGGNLPARISFYDDYFVVARLTLNKVPYSEIRSISFKRGWILNSVTVHFDKGRSLFFHPRNIEKVQSLIKTCQKETKKGQTKKGHIL